MSKRQSFRSPEGCQERHLSADHTFEKVSVADTDGQDTLLGDNSKSNFGLVLYMHRYDVESFHIMNESVDFFFDGDGMPSQPRSYLHNSPGIEHACVLSEGCSAVRLLMIFQPSGFALHPPNLERLNKFEFEDDAKMKGLHDIHNNINAGPRQPMAFP